MNFEKALLKEHSRAQAESIARYIGNDQHKFDQLLPFLLNENIVLTQRAAFCYGIVFDHYPQLAKPHLQKILAHISTNKVHDAVKRCAMRMLQFMEIPKKLHPKVIELCFHYLFNKSEAIAIRVFSMETLHQMCKHYPELANELVPFIEIEMEQGASPGFVSRGKKVLKSLQKHKGIGG